MRLVWVVGPSNSVGETGQVVGPSNSVDETGQAVGPSNSVGETSVGSRAQY